MYINCKGRRSCIVRMETLSARRLYRLVGYRVSHMPHSAACPPSGATAERRKRKKAARSTAVQSHRIHHRIPSHTIAYHRIPSHTIAYHRIPSHTIAYHRIPSHTIAYHRIPSHTTYKALAKATAAVTALVTTADTTLTPLLSSSGLPDMGDTSGPRVPVTFPVVLL